MARLFPIDISPSTPWPDSIGRIATIHSTKNPTAGMNHPRIAANHPGPGSPVNVTPDADNCVTRAVSTLTVEKRVTPPSPGSLDFPVIAVGPTTMSFSFCC
ncbi:MAG: hypothetical protein EXR07_12960 [Acetobacteraceae bacterium]|nr:hypothetical protein [Acetobacteraceae bacterium]